MSFKSTCNRLIGDLFSSKEPKQVTEEEIEQNKDFDDAYYEKLKAHSDIRDGYKPKNVKDAFNKAKTFLKEKVVDTDFSYLVGKGYGAVKYDIKTLQQGIQNATTKASESIHSDFQYETEENGKTKMKMLDRDSMVDISLYISSANNIAMYQHMQDEVRDYDGIYFQDDFEQLLNDGNVNKEQRENFKTMYADKYMDVKEYLIDKRKKDLDKEELSKAQLSFIEDVAHREAINYTYIEGFLRRFNEKMKKRVFSNPKALQVYKNIMERRKELTETSSDSMRKAGRSIDQLFIFSPEQYYRAVFRDLKKRDSYGRRKDIFSYEEKSTKREGTTKSPSTNFFVSELSYRSLLIQETAKADFMAKIRENPRYDKTQELLTSLNSSIEGALKNFSNKIDNDDLDDSERMMIATFVHKFNKLVGSRYEDLAILNDDISKKTKYTINGKTKNGNIFQQLQDYLQVAINNEKTLMQHSINKGDYDELFKKYPQFKYLKDGNPTERDFIMFGRFFAKNENKRTNPVKFTKFRELEQGLRNSTLSMMGFDFQKDILPNVLTKDGVRRVLVNDMGTSLRTQTDIETSLDDIAKDAHLVSKEQHDKLGKEYQKEYEKNLENLRKEYGQEEDVEFESIESFGNEASLLAIDSLQSKYGTNSIKSLFYADAKNATALTKQELQKIFLSGIPTERDARDFEEQIRASNSFIQDVLDGNIRLIDSEVSRAIQEVQRDIINQEFHRDGSGVKFLKQVTRYSKFGLLYSPTRVLKFNTNNTVGDVTLTMYNRPELALDIFNYKKLSDWFLKYYQKAGREFDAEEQYFMDNSQGFQRKNYEEMLGNLDAQSQRELEKMRREIEKREGKKFTVASGMVDMKTLFGKYAKFVTGVSEMREMYLRKSIFKKVLSELRTNGKVRNYGTVQRKAVESIIDEANAQTDEHKKDEFYKQASLVYANQALIMYDDLSKFANFMSQYGMPFIRYAEGNVRAHFRMFNNFLHEYREAIQTQNYKQFGKTTARASMNGAIAMALPIAIWNAIQMALFGLDDEDIPEYAKRSGYLLLGNTFISNTDIFSDFASNMGVNDLRYNLSTNIKDKGLVSGIINGIGDSISLQQGIDDRIASYVSPLFKFPFEAYTAIDLYPDSKVYVGDRYTKYQNLTRKTLNLIGMERVFEMAYHGLDKNSKMNKNLFEFFGFKMAGDDMNEYFLARQNALEYSEEVLGREQRIGHGYQDKDMKKKLRYGIYQAIKNQDDDYTLQLFNRYVEYTEENTETREEFDKEIQSLKQSLKKYFDVIPSSAIPQKEYENYIATLNDDEFERLQNAYMNQEELLGMYYGFIYGDE